MGEVQAQYADKQLENTIAKNADIQNTVLPNAMKRLDFLKANSDALNKRELNPEFLEITGQLGDEISPELSRERAKIAVEEAKFQARQSKAALAVNEAFAKSIDPETGEIRLKLALGSQSLVKIVNEAKDRATVTSKPTAANAAQRYGR